MSGWPKSGSPYHPGEQRVQERAGARDFAERIGRQVIRDFLTDQHRAFYPLLPYVFVGSLDAQRRPWASVLSGAPGFLSSPDDRRIAVRARAPEGDPLARNLAPGSPVAMVGVQFETRRRNRVNGWVRSVGDDGFEFEVSQSFGNCPQYIQARKARWPNDVSKPRGRPSDEDAVLSQRASELIARADTFFIASASPNAGDENPVEGVDVNHRGGRPGFVQVSEENSHSVIRWPDFVGNSAFNTLGNIALNPVAGLLFIDFERGDVLSVTGSAEIVWDEEQAAGLRGAERVVSLRIDSGVYIAEALPIRWGGVQHASQLADTGTWAEARESQAAHTLANRLRPFVVLSTLQESETVRSFLLEPADGISLPPHQAGQFLPITVRPRTDAPEMRRTYTISNAPRQGHYRLSIKREAGDAKPPGVVSNWFHDQVQAGTVIHALAPRGDFVLQTPGERPVVLISAGVGVTPMIAMVDFLTSAHSERPRYPDLPLLFMHFARNTREHAFARHLRSLASRRTNLRLHFRFDEPLATDRAGVDYDSIGQIDSELIAALRLPAECDVYLCGPTGFMQRAYDLLLAAGIPNERIAFESFGPSSIARARVETPLAPPVHRAVVRFQKSGRVLEWRPPSGFLLDAAKVAGLDLPWSCREGHCGTCRARVLSGSVTYAQHPVAPSSPGSALLCCALPASADLVIDA